jgi:hypothetical protein
MLFHDLTGMFHKLHALTQHTMLVQKVGMPSIPLPLTSPQGAKQYIGLVQPQKTWGCRSGKSWYRAILVVHMLVQTPVHWRPCTRVIFRGA